eukprot:1144284-Pelagomonas_calceolata.AAC.1
MEHRATAHVTRRWLAGLNQAERTLNIQLFAMEHRATACSSMPMHFLTLLSVAVLWKKRTEQENLSRPDKAACIKGMFLE